MEAFDLEVNRAFASDPTFPVLGTTAKQQQQLPGVHPLLRGGEVVGGAAAAAVCRKPRALVSTTHTFRTNRENDARRLLSYGLYYQRAVLTEARETVPITTLTWPHKPSM